jgi:phosphoglycolate phosphatase
MPQQRRGAAALLGSFKVKYRLVIFDLDGTLADSFPWFIRIVNTVADKYRFRHIEPEHVETLRGMPARGILGFLDVPRWKLPFIARHMRALKTKHLPDIPLFPGVDKMLRELHGAGITIALVRSDHEANVRQSLGAENAELVSHYACGAALFGKAAKFKRVRRASGVAPHETLAIGDETRDAEAARAAGIAFGAVTWGYASPAALTVQRPDEVFQTVGKIAPRLTSPI